MLIKSTNCTSCIIVYNLIVRPILIQFFVYKSHKCKKTEDLNTKHSSTLSPQDGTIFTVTHHIF